MTPEQEAAYAGTFAHAQESLAIAVGSLVRAAWSVLRGLASRVDRLYDR